MSGNHLSEQEIVDRNVEIHVQRLRAEKKADTPSPDSLRREARSLVQHTYRSQAFLKRILALHSNLIKARWTKKRSNKRREILEVAWPNMPKEHRPDFDAFYSKREDDDAFMLPYINAQDLEQKDILLLFMESRAKNSPSKFAYTDLEEAVLGLNLGKIVPARLESHTMFLRSSTASDYGELVSWADSPSSKVALQSGEGFEPGKGLIVLKIQCKILEFLLRCCQTMLQEKSAEELLGVDNLETIAAFEHHLSSRECHPVGQQESEELVFDEPLKPQSFELANKTSVSPNELPSIASIALSAPYRLPENLPFNHLLEIANARVGAAEDHILGLRADPGYFLEKMNDIFEHKLENVLDKAGNPDRKLENPRTWESVASELVQTAYAELCVWSEASRRLKKLCSLQEKYQRAISKKQDLPHEFLVVLLALQMHLSKMGSFPRAGIDDAIRASPLLRSNFVRLDSDMVKPIVSKTSDPPGDVFLRALMEIGEEILTPYANLPIFVDHIRHLLKDPKNRSQLSSHVLSKLSDLEIVAEFTRQLDLCQPWATTLNQDLSGPRREADGCWAAEEKSKLFSLSVLAGVELTGLIDPIQTRFDYPSSERSQQGMMQMRAAESNLRDFWSTVDFFFSIQTRRTLVQTFHGNFAREKIPPALQTPERREPETLKSNPNSGNRGKKLDTRNADSATVPKLPKVKTRGIPHPKEPDALTPLEPEKSSNEKPIPLSRAPYKVFKALFFTPGQSDPPGEISWKAFLNAMACAGFSGQKLSGSAWLFQPSAKMNLKRSIHFHEPHPSDKIPFTWARFMGRSLSHAYRWDINSFEQK